MPLDYLILTPTYNRAPMLNEVITHLDNERRQHELAIQHVIVDDCSENQREYAELVSHWQEQGYTLTYLRNEINCGRDEFWKVWTRLLDYTKRQEFNYGVAVSDDLILCRDFLKRSSRNFDFLREQDERCIAMNLLCLHPRNWGLDRYVDGAFIAVKRFFQLLKFGIKPIPKEHFRGSQERENRSSGVHKQISQRIAQSGWKIAPVTGNSFCMVRGDNGSVLFPKDRFPTRLGDNTKWTCTFVDASP